MDKETKDELLAIALSKMAADWATKAKSADNKTEGEHACAFRYKGQAFAGALTYIVSRNSRKHLVHIKLEVFRMNPHQTNKVKLPAIEPEGKFPLKAETVSLPCLILEATRNFTEVIK